MPLAYRIVKTKRAASAFVGDGARRAGGRWNSPGRRAVYIASSASLAALEILVHVDRSALLSAYVLFEVEFGEDIVSTVRVDSLPTGCRSNPPPPELAAVGDEWIARGSSAALRVPSAVIPIEWNYVLNPAHPDFASIRIGEPVSFDFDERLGQTQSEL